MLSRSATCCTRLAAATVSRTAAASSSSTSFPLFSSNSRKANPAAPLQQQQKQQQRIPISTAMATSSVAASAAAAAPPPAPKKYSLLFYTYVPDILERRDPFRAAHIQGAKDAVARGEMAMAGALAEPVDGAVFVFAPGVSVEKIEEFAKKDPYVVNGLVPEWKIRPWMVVAE